MFKMDDTTVVVRPELVLILIGWKYWGQRRYKLSRYSTLWTFLEAGCAALNPRCISLSESFMESQVTMHCFRVWYRRYKKNGNIWRLRKLKGDEKKKRSRWWKLQEWGKTFPHPHCTCGFRKPGLNNTNPEGLWCRSWLVLQSWPRLIQRPGIVRNHYQLAKRLIQVALASRHLLEIIKWQQHRTHTFKYDVWSLWSLSLSLSLERTRRLSRRKFNFKFKLNFQTCKRKTPASREKNNDNLYFQLLSSTNLNSLWYMRGLLFISNIYKGNLFFLVEILIYSNKSRCDSYSRQWSSQGRQLRLHTDGKKNNPRQTVGDIIFISGNQ